jgi:probable HAF family extracellular repeat protein
MKCPNGLFVILTSLLCASGLPASADPGYRLVPITADGSTGIAVFDLNRRGELVGMRTIAGVTRAFGWRAGHFTDLHDAIDPGATYTQAAGINDRSAIVGVNLVGDSFRGFLLRGSQVSPIAVVPGESQVFPFDINNRGQIIVDSVGGGQEGSFLIDGDNVRRLEGLPGETDSMHSVAINERGVIIGHTRTAAGTRAVLWQDGAIMNLGVVAGGESSFADDLNDRDQVVGFSNIGGGSHAMRWQNGTMSLLPRLVGEAASAAQSINNWGVIVGGTTLLQPEFRSTAALWFGSHVVELDRLVRAADPLKAFVHLESAAQINDRGDILVSGFDSRAPAERTMYFMTLFDN